LLVGVTHTVIKPYIHSWLLRGSI